MNDLVNAISDFNSVAVQLSKDQGSLDIDTKALNEAQAAVDSAKTVVDTDAATLQAKFDTIVRLSVAAGLKINAPTGA